MNCFALSLSVAFSYVTIGEIASEISELIGKMDRQISAAVHNRMRGCEIKEKKKEGGKIVKSLQGILKVIKSHTGSEIGQIRRRFGVSDEDTLHDFKGSLKRRKRNKKTVKNEESRIRKRRRKCTVDENKKRGEIAHEKQYRRKQQSGEEKR